MISDDAFGGEPDVRISSSVEPAGFGWRAIVSLWWDYPGGATVSRNYTAWRFTYKQMDRWMDETRKEIEENL